jgi:hypothetical protein
MERQGEEGPEDEAADGDVAVEDEPTPQLEEALNVLADLVAELQS